MKKLSASYKIDWKTLVSHKENYEEIRQRMIKSAITKLTDHIVEEKIYDIRSVLEKRFGEDVETVFIDLYVLSEKDLQQILGSINSIKCFTRGNTVSKTEIGLIEKEILQIKKILLS